MNRLSESMRCQWQEQGYLHLKNAIPQDEVAGYLQAVDEVIEQYETENPGLREQGAYPIIEVLFQISGMDPLMDHPNLFGVILDLMGPYLQIMGSEIYVRYPGGEMPKWHTDAGRSLGQIRVTPDSLPLNFKIQFFLTDILEEDHTNFCLVPGSHRRPMPEAGSSQRSVQQGQSVSTRDGKHWEAKETTPSGAIQMIAEAGDCAIFPNTLWHAVSPNNSGVVRRSFALRYGQMWCRPFDYEKCPEEVLARMTPRRRRLMGDLGERYTATDYFKPRDQIEVIMEGLEFECPHA